MMWNQKGRWKNEVLGQARHPNNVNIAKPLMESLHSMCLRCDSQTAAICFQRDCGACGLVGGAGWWSVNEADTLSLCIELIHLIKGVCVSLGSRSGAVDLYLKNTPSSYTVNELKPWGGEGHGNGNGEMRQGWRLMMDTFRHLPTCMCLPSLIWRVKKKKSQFQ